MIFIFVSIFLSHYEEDKNTKPRPEGGDQVHETDAIGDCYVCFWCAYAQTDVGACMCTMPVLNHNLFPPSLPFNSSSGDIYLCERDTDRVPKIPLCISLPHHPAPTLILKDSPCLTFPKCCPVLAPSVYISLCVYTEFALGIGILGSFSLLNHIFAFTEDLSFVIHRYIFEQMKKTTKENQEMINVGFAPVDACIQHFNDVLLQVSTCSLFMLKE